MNKSLHFGWTMLLVCGLFFSYSLKAQTTLGLGEIAFTGYQSDPPNKVSFILLKPVEAGTVISFTDNGWLAAGGFRSIDIGGNILTPELAMSWIADVAYPCGTQILLLPATNESFDQMGSVAGTLLNPDLSIVSNSAPFPNFPVALDTNGDQLFAFQGALPTASNTSGFITAIQMNGAWDTDATTGNSSAQPPVFIDGVHSLSIDPKIKNASYACGPPQFVQSADTPTQLAAMINNSDNWSLSINADLVIPPTCNFEVCCTVLEDIATGSPTCPTDTDGTVTITASFCSLSGIYTIAGPVNDTNTTGVFTGLPAGDYTLTVADASLPAGTCQETGAFTVVLGVDATAPVITTCLAPVSGLVCGDLLPAAPQNGTDFIEMGGVLSDNCSATEDIIIFTQVSTTGDFCNNNAPYVITRTYFAMDGSGNISTCEQTISFLETAMAPVITSVLPTCYKYCASLANPSIGDISYETSCNGDATVNITGPVQIGQGNCPGTIYRYTYTVVDDCQQSSSPVTRDFIIGNDGPSITAPIYNLILECGDPNNESYIDTHITLVTASSACGLGVSINHFPQNFNSITCGTATVVTFVATDACGRTATASTTIAIQDLTAPTFTSVPPSVCDEIECGADADFWFAHWIDYMEIGLSATDACDNNVSIAALNPQLNTNCNAEGQAISVVIFAATDNCNNTTTMTGAFTITNTAPPIFADIPVDATITCNEVLTFGTPTLLEDCQTTLTFSESVDDTVPCAPAFTRVWTATDACGGLTASASQTITVLDSVAPVFTFVPMDESILCTEMPVFGTPLISDNCLGLNPLTFVDAEILDGCNSIFTRVWTATDGCGNTTTASQQIDLLGNDPASLTGFIFTEEEEAVEEVVVSLQGANGFNELDLSQADGTYGFNDLNLGENYTLTPKRNTDPLNGVSTYDLVLISKHILQTQVLDSPYKQIAADVNNSGSISTLDLVALRKMILHIDTEFQNNESWRFIAADFIFPQVEHPFSSNFPEVTYLNALQAGEGHNYIGVKIGDVNNTALPHSYMELEDRTTTESVHLVMANLKMTVGETYEVAVRAENFEAVNGFQFALHFDPAKLDFVGMASADLPSFSENNFGFTKIHEGKLLCSWNIPNAATLDATASLFKLTFKAKATTTLTAALSMDVSSLHAEAYNKDLDLLGLDLRFDGVAATDSNNRYTLYQNQPNPFKTNTVIGFELPRDMSAALMVYDLSGRIVKEYVSNFPKGYNEWVIDKSELNGGGLFYYRLLTSDFEATKKMMIIE